MSTPPSPSPVPLSHFLSLLAAGALAIPALLLAAENPPATASYPFATQTLTVPAGFTVELVAGPPLVNRPISIAFDERGRLYATDSSGLSERATQQFEEKPHRIVRLEDTDGDGRYDRSTAYAEKMMFPQGALFHNGSLYVAAPPHIWKLTDADDDGVAEKREVWWDGKTLTGCANDVHGPYLGPDGWFYWTKGAFAEQHHTLGTGRPFVTRAAHIYRSRPDGSAFEPVMTGGMDNPVGVAFTATGERILCGTFFQIPAAGRRDGLIHAIYGGVYGKENAAAVGHARTGDLMPILTHMGAAAPCGITQWRSSAFGAEFTGNLFVCYFNLRKIVRHELVPAGATFTTREMDFVTSDSADFRPTDVLEDADGSLLVVDTGGWYKICCPTSQLAKPDVLGSIYRIRRQAAPKTADPRGLRLPWGSMTLPDLAQRLDDPRPDVRDRAMVALEKAGAGAVAALRDAANAPGSRLARQNRIWTLARLNLPEARAAVRAALEDPDHEVVHAALQVVSLWRDAAAEPHLLRLLASPVPALARLAAEGLGRIGSEKAVELLLRTAGRLPLVAVSASGTPADPVVRAMEHALVFALIEIARPEPLLARLGAGENPPAVRVALLALDQMAAGQFNASHVLPWLESKDAMLQRTAGWIVSHRPEWGEALAGHFHRRLTSAPASGPAATDLQAQLVELARSAAIQEVLATAASAGTDATRHLALRTMAAAGLKETPPAWLKAIAQALDPANEPLARQAVATARSLPLPKKGDLPPYSALARTGRSTSLPAELRLDALALAAGSLDSIDPDLFRFLRTQLVGKDSLFARATAAAALARAPLSDEQRLLLADAMREVGALEAPRLLAAFERGPTEVQGRRLLLALRESPALGGLRVDLLRPLFARYPATLQPELTELLARLNSDAARQNARVAEVLPALPQGDIRRGQALFNSDRTACTLCHKVGYRGGALGPDLTGIGKIRSERELLEAVMFPSATLVRGYEPVTATLESGESHTGLLRQETAAEIVLATGPETEVHLARGRVTELRPGTTSPMPPGMDVILTAPELADLVAFLKSRR